MRDLNIIALEEVCHTAGGTFRREDDDTIETERPEVREVIRRREAGTI